MRVLNCTVLKIKSKDVDLFIPSAPGQLSSGFFLSRNDLPPAKGPPGMLVNHSLINTRPPQGGLSSATLPAALCSDGVGFNKVPTAAMFTCHA